MRSKDFQERHHDPVPGYILHILDMYYDLLLTLLHLKFVTTNHSPLATIGQFCVADA